MDRRSSPRRTANNRNTSFSIMSNTDNMGEWQLCPKCQGEGQVHDPNDGMSTNPYRACPVCNGAKVLARPGNAPFSNFNTSDSLFTFSLYEQY